MIFIAILDLIFELISPLLNIFLPVIPSEVTNVIGQGLRYMADGAAYVVWFLWTPRIFRYFIGFIFSTTFFLYGLDLIWKVINLIKLRRMQ